MLDVPRDGRAAVEAEMTRQKPYLIFSNALIFDYDFEAFFILPPEGKHYLREDAIEVLRVTGGEPQNVQAWVN